MTGEKYSDDKNLKSTDCTTVEILSDSIFLFFYIVKITFSDNENTKYKLMSFISLNNWIAICNKNIN